MHTAKNPVYYRSRIIFGWQGATRTQLPDACRQNMSTIHCKLHLLGQQKDMYNLARPKPQAKVRAWRSCAWPNSFPMLYAVYASLLYNCTPLRIFARSPIPDYFERGRSYKCAKKMNLPCMHQTSYTTFVLLNPLNASSDEI